MKAGPDMIGGSLSTPRPNISTVADFAAEADRRSSGGN